jgi:hypothetical protein
MPSPCQHPDGLGKAHAILPLDKRENISAGTTAKTMKDLFVGVDAERRRFFVMKGTEAKIISSLLFESDMIGDDVDNIDGEPNFID